MKRLQCCRGRGFGDEASLPEMKRIRGVGSQRNGDRLAYVCLREIGLSSSHLKIGRDPFAVITMNGCIAVAGRGAFRMSCVQFEKTCNEAGRRKFQHRKQARCGAAQLYDALLKKNSQSSTKRGGKRCRALGLCTAAQVWFSMVSGGEVLATMSNHGAKSWVDVARGWCQRADSGPWSRGCGAMFRGCGFSPSLPANRRMHAWHTQWTLTARRGTAASARSCREFQAGRLPLGSAPPGRAPYQQPTAALWCRGLPATLLTQHPPPRGPRARSPQRAAPASPGADCGTQDTGGRECCPCPKAVPASAGPLLVALQRQVGCRALPPVLGRHAARSAPSVAGAAAGKWRASRKKSGGGRWESRSLAHGSPLTELVDRSEANGNSVEEGGHMAAVPGAAGADAAAATPP